MSIPSIKKRLCAAIASCSLLVAYQPISAEVLEQTFAPINKTVPSKASVNQAYFVRLDLVPVSVWLTNKKEQGVSVSKQEKDNYIAGLRAEVAKAMAAFNTQGLTAGSSSIVADVGFTVYATSEKVSKMTNVSGVSAIMKKHNHSRHRDHSTPWVGGSVAHSSGLTGAGQRIAIIDSGLDYIHRDFGGSGDYSNNDVAVVEPGSFPTARVIDGHDFVGREYDARFAASSTPQPDADPFDDGRHGTHVSGIAAGNGVDGVVGTGIAPDASLIAYKVFGADGSTNVTSDAIERAMDPNGDGDTSDKVDVINMSLGSPFGNPNDETSRAAQNASDAGIVVVASAGNSGNGIPFISGSPGAAEDVVTVASSVSGFVPEFFIPFNSASGERFEFFAEYAAISPALTTDIIGDVTIAEPYDACAPIAAIPQGNIALITRGGCSFTTKLQSALDAGAEAAIVVNNVPGPAIVMGGTDVNIEAAMISLDEGTVLLSELAGNAVGTEFVTSNTAPNPANDNSMSVFSSRGPGATGLFKPDISAPGQSITSARAGTGDGSLVLSGTSMAAPQVAGMAALLKQKFPDLSVAGIKAIIQNTSTPAVDLFNATGTPPLSLQGTGVINIEKALQATSYVSPGGIGFGRQNPEYNGEVTRSITINNFSNEGKRYRITHEPNQQLPEGAARISVNSEVYVGAGQSQTIPVTIYLQANNMVADTDLTEMDGWLVVTSGDEAMRVGYQLIADPASRLNFSNQGDTTYVRNDAFGDAQVFAYTLAEQTSSPSDTALEAMGFRSTSPTAIAFGLSAGADWTNFSRKTLNMFIDADEDGQDDYRIEVKDLEFFNPDPDDPDGRIVSGITDLSNPEAGTALLFFAQADFNSSILQFQALAYGPNGFLQDGDTRFAYRLVYSDLFGASETRTQSGVIDLAKQVNFDTPAISVPAQQSVPVEVTAGGVSSLWLSPTESTLDRRAVVR
ncbi:S8 family peptidase [Agarilytica rhodophyticola]|uniref:S8 family peptidase n=1 Tax=Agarilytica rhodophyticola TaxID=1737490 RepID=UPI000B346522|nr:S8 family serine peptidase [Agarilytica rhodophyticola]